MSRLVFAFLRHGEYQQLKNTPSSWQPFALNSKGQTQAKSAAPLIIDFCQQNQLILEPVFDSSNMLRAWQTANILINELNSIAYPEVNNQSFYKIKSYDALAERGVGCAANLSTTMIEQVIDDDPRYETLPSGWKSDSYFKLPFQGSESLLDAGQRVADHIRETLQQFNNTEQHDTLKVIVGHGAAFRHAAYHLGILKFEEIKKYSMFHAQPVFFERLEKNWQHIGGDWKIRKKNSEYKD